MAPGDITMLNIMAVGLLASSKDQGTVHDFRPKTLKWKRMKGTWDASTRAGGGSGSLTGKEPRTP